MYSESQKLSYPRKRGLRGLFPELAKVFEGFPSCSRSHCAPTFLPLYPETSKDCNREVKRINGLSVFIGSVEQPIENKETSQKTDKLRDCKNWYKSIWSSTKRKRVRSGPIFYKKGGKVVFNFQHFVKPEKIIGEYTRVNIYNKPRLVKINKKESPKSTLSVHEKRVSSEVDFRRCKFKCEKPRSNTDATDEKIPGWRLKKSAEIVPKKTRRVPKRISATHNFVYEFNPFGNSTLVCNDATTAKGGRNVSNIGQGDSPLRSTSGKQNSSNASAALPKLQPRNDAMLVNLERHESITNCAKNPNLPNIKKQEMGVEQRFVKDRDEKRKRNPVSEIDREVEKVKSDWRALRTEGGWTQSKNFASIRTRKLYDTLEKMNYEIDKIQKSYLDPKSNQYLHRGAMKALEPLQSFEEKAGKIKEMLFPKENNKIVDASLKNISNDVLKGTLPNEISLKDRKFEKKSFLSDMKAQNTRSGVKTNSNSLLNFNKRSTSANSRINSSKINPDIEKYLNEYINEAERNFVNKEESKIKEFDVPSDDVAEMLKKMNINSFDIYSIGDEYEENSLLQSVERTRSARRQNSTCSLVNEKVGSAKITEKAIQKDWSRKQDHVTRYTDVLNSDTSIQTKTKTTYKDNAFIEMGLHALGNNFPQNTLSRVLQSEYLRKDASLKPM